MVSLTVVKQGCPTGQVRKIHKICRKIMAFTDRVNKGRNLKDRPVHAQGRTVHRLNPHVAKTGSSGDGLSFAFF